MTLAWPWPILGQGKILSLMLLYGKKVKQWIFQKLLWSVMSELVDTINYMSTWTYMNIKGQGHSMTLVQGQLDSTFSNFFSLETARPIEAKFHMEPPWDRETKVCSNDVGHMTSMAAMPIYGKNLKKSSSPEPKGRWPWNLVCSIGCSSTIKFLRMVTLGWHWHILLQGQIWSLML